MSSHYSKFAKIADDHYNMQMTFAIQLTQIVTAILLMTLILIQSKGVGLSGSFGGGGEVYYTRRGAEKVIFWGTIVIAILFTLSSLVGVIIT